MKIRSIQKIQATPDFKKSFSKLPPHIQRLFTKKEYWFKANSYDPRLKTHALHGKLYGFHAYSINREYRVLFKFLKSAEVAYYDIGTHAIYK